MKTRAKRTTGSETVSSKSDSGGKNAKLPTLPPSLVPAPNVFVLPKSLSGDARIISITTTLHDRTTENRRYLICPERGFFEFTRLATPKHACRSWLLSPETTGRETSLLSGSNTDSNDGQGSKNDEAYVFQSPDLMVATPLDPLFLMLSVKGALWPNVLSGKPEYLTLDSRLGLLKSHHEDIDLVLRGDRQGRLERICADRMKAVCDVVEIPGDEDESMYCLSLRKLYVELVKIAKRVVAAGIPKSMNDHFVRQQLIVPEVGLCKEDSAVSLADQEEEPKAERVSLEEPKSQDLQASAEVTNLLRLRTVVNYMMASYMPLDLREALQGAAIKSGQGQSCIDFKPLDDFLAYTAELRTKANVLRSLSENIIRKRSAYDDEEDFEKQDAKKRKKEQEEFKKKNTTRGVQQLAKADTSGMKKLSAFFTKAATKKA